MKIIDLTHPVREGMPAYPGKDGPLIREDAVMKEDHYREKHLSLLTHTGTHIDAPAHMMEQGLYLDELPVESFMGPAVLLQRTGEETGPISLEEVLSLEKELEKADFLLLATGWDRFWGEKRFFQNYPCLTEEAAGYLITRGLKGIGLDTTSADPVNSGTFPIHKALLGAGMVIVENLKGLTALPGREFLFSCFPLNIEKADGSPVRAVGVYL